MEDELLYRIAYMYYVREMTLEEIGDELRSLHIQLLPPPKIPNYKKPPQYPPATISKNLRRARERGIVRFVVDPPLLPSWRKSCGRGTRLRMRS
jgi:DNA-binding transcriptional regulator LsrR (DeoR family)